MGNFSLLQVVIYLLLHRFIKRYEVYVVLTTLRLVHILITYTFTILNKPTNVLYMPVFLHTSNNQL